MVYVSVGGLSLKLAQGVAGPSAGQERTPETDPGLGRGRGGRLQHEMPGHQRRPERRPLLHVDSLTSAVLIASLGVAS
jgi:hypothetical protein